MTFTSFHVAVQVVVVSSGAVTRSAEASGAEPARGTLSGQVILTVVADVAFITVTPVAHGCAGVEDALRGSPAWLQ